MILIDATRMREGRAEERQGEEGRRDKQMELGKKIPDPRNPSKPRARHFSEDHSSPSGSCASSSGLRKEGLPWELCQLCKHQHRNVNNNMQAQCKHNYSPASGGGRLAGDLHVLASESPNLHGGD